MIENNFDDYLDLLNYDFSKYKYIIFVWNSWSGKSSYIKKLIKINKSLDSNIVIVDEVFDLTYYLKIFFQLFFKKQFIIASHISINYFYIFSFLWKVKYIKIDEDHYKICNYLQCKNFKYSDDVVQKYIKSFSSTYTDIDIILENYSWNDFDEAFYNFIKFNKVNLTRNKNNK
jgi:energy-coupling factor transporter ATP-binding protein EcfA2